MTPPLIELRDIGIVLGGRDALARVSVALEPGRFVALIGPNGAGKTTLIKAIAGLVRASGRILLAGDDLARIPRRERAKRIAYLPQGHQVHWPLRARDVVALGRFPHGLVDPGAASAADHAAVETALARADIGHLADRPIGSLSGGERARVMLARVLATQAQIILADEPIAALDPRHQLAVMQDLKRESHNGTLVIAVTHDLGLAARLADVVLLMHAGRLVAKGAPDAILTDAQLAEIYGVRAIRQKIGEETLLVPWALAP